MPEQATGLTRRHLMHLIAMSGALTALPMTLGAGAASATPVGRGGGTAGPNPTDPPKDCWSRGS